MTTNAYYVPQSLEEAIGLLAEHGPTILVMAGGTIVCTQMRITRAISFRTARLFWEISRVSAKEQQTKQQTQQAGFTRARKADDGDMLIGLMTPAAIIVGENIYTYRDMVPVPLESRCGFLPPPAVPLPSG